MGVRSVLENWLLRSRPADALAGSKWSCCDCTGAHNHVGWGVLRPNSHIIPTQTQQICPTKSQHWSLRQQHKCNLNTVIRFRVQTQCFNLLRQTYMLQTLCLPFLPNILNPNTVFALLRININDLIFTDARLWGTLRAQRCQYTALPCANIGWFGSQCLCEPACYELPFWLRRVCEFHHI